MRILFPSRAHPGDSHPSVIPCSSSPNPQTLKIHIFIIHDLQSVSVSLINSLRYPLRMSKLCTPPSSSHSDPSRTVPGRSTLRRSLVFYLCLSTDPITHCIPRPLNGSLHGSLLSCFLTVLDLSRHDKVVPNLQAFLGVLALPLLPQALCND